MMTNLLIRECQLNECAAVLNLWQETETTPSITDDIEVLTQLVRDNRELFLVAERDGRIVGTIVGGWDYWRGNIYRLTVSPEYRRQGIGRALVEEVEHRLAEKGTKKISILVEHKDAQAVSLPPGQAAPPSTGRSASTQVVNLLLGGKDIDRGGRRSVPDVDAGAKTVGGLSPSHIHGPHDGRVVEVQAVAGNGVQLVGSQQVVQ